MRRANRSTSVCVCMMCVAIASAMIGCGRDEPPALLTEITAEAGFDASPPRWPDGRYHVAEISAGGVALFDYDGDGDLDIYLVVHPPPDQPDAPAPNRLYQQQSDGRFIEVPDAAGLNDPGYGNGAAIGDVNNDGHPDVYVTNFGPDALYVSNGNGTFRNATAEAGIGGDHWSTSAAFFDYDGDGHLDLYVCHYLLYDPTRVCRPALDAKQDYCGPARFQGVPDTLYHNNGDGTFRDVSKEAGITSPTKGMGVVCLDLTRDGRTDIYVTNDMQPNQLYVNQGDGTFVDEAAKRGAAVSGAGQPQASMGVAAGDVNGDGRLDLFMTHLGGETHTLYQSIDTAEQGGTFADRSATSRIGAATLAYTGWGCAMADFDHDGLLDLAVVHGRIARGPALPGAARGPFWNDYAEPNMLFRGEAGGVFADVSSRTGLFGSRPEVTHALAAGDLDGDGDADLVTVDVGNVVRVYRNDAPPKGSHWLGVRAMIGKRDALGATVELHLPDGRRMVRPVISAYSFQSASEAVARFGLGETSKVEFVVIHWPEGIIGKYEVESVDRVVTLALRRSRIDTPQGGFR